MKYLPSLIALGLLSLTLGFYTPRFNPVMTKKWSTLSTEEKTLFDKITEQVLEMNLLTCILRDI
jgi:hypothetical protein